MTAPTQPTRRVAALAALSCLPALLAACGVAGSPAAAPAVTKTVTAPAPSTAATTSPAASPTASSGPGPCPTSGLRAKIGLTQGAAGSAYAVIDFTNISGSTCTLYGYPGVSFVTSSGSVVGVPAARNSPPAARLVTLAPGGIASSLLRISDAGVYPPARCHAVSVRRMQVYPPNQRAALFLFYATTVCSKPLVTLHVNVVIPGSGGSA